MTRRPAPAPRACAQEGHAPEPVIGRTHCFNHEGVEREATLLRVFPGCVKVETDLGSGWPHRVFLDFDQLGPEALPPRPPMGLPVTLRKGLLHSMDEREFTQLLAASLSLSVEEKKRVVLAIPGLSQFQVDELSRVFEDEDLEFARLWPKEAELIRELQKMQRSEWEEIVNGLRYRSSSMDLFSILDDGAAAGGVE